MTIIEIESAIKDKFKENAKKYHRREWYDVCVVNDNTIEIEIDNGDWKFDHIYVKNVVFDVLKPLRYEEVLCDDSEDDCYSAIHRFVFDAIAS